MPETERTAFQIEPRPGAVIRGDVRRSSSTDGADGRAVVVCHGFKGFKDWGFFPFAASWLATELACPVVTFNFSGSGVGEDLENFTDPEAFGRNTFSLELADLDAVLGGLAAGRLGEADLAPARRIGVLGHSRGGIAAILSGERAPVRAVVTWAAIASVERYAKVFDGLPPDEPHLVRNARTGDVLPLHRDVLHDIRAHPARFDLDASLARSEVPLLVLHGAADESVPIEEGRTLGGIGPRTRFEAIEGAGHTFEVGHPFEGPSTELLETLRRTRGHFATHL